MHHSINCEGQRPADPVTLDLTLQEIVPLLLDPQHPLPTPPPNTFKFTIHFRHTCMHHSINCEGYGLSGVISINYLHPSKVNDLHPSEVGRQLMSSIELHYTFDDDVCKSLSRLNVQYTRQANLHNAIW